ncbi:hypothetical protein [Microbacterium sp. cf332]|uniref:hypothetical protein n=1 Tax=Microbacterium sp. cf332 TaxID=1761804 RepID=UPI00115FAC3E|nr:hypothetical protein [Microbacterium sp. cf332]
MIVASLLAGSTAPDASDVRTLELIGSLRGRLVVARDELSAVRRRAAELDHETAWRARAALEYRRSLGAWRERLAEAAARMELLDDELRGLERRLAEAVAQAGVAGQGAR